MTKLAFLDTETTGLDPERHEIWELAIIIRDGDWGDGQWTWHLPVDLAKADPTGLRIGRFYERRRKLPMVHDRGCLIRYPESGENNWDRVNVADAAMKVAGLLDGAHIVGAVPNFDAAFLTPWLRANGQAATWHYHLVDVEALAAGHLAATSDHREKFQPPWNSNELSLCAGIDPAEFDRHTAMGDAMWAQAIYDAVMTMRDVQYPENPA